MSSTPLLAEAERLTLKSPKGVLTLSVGVDSAGTVTYSVNRGKEPVLLSSRLGFEPDWVNGFTVASSARSQHSEYWKPLYGERDAAPDIYNELSVKLARANGHGFMVQFRAYDEGVALRYGSPEPIQVTKELTEFKLPSNSFAYEEHGTEGEYLRNPISAIATRCQTPLTIEISGGTYAAVLEAANVDFPQMTVASEQGAQNTLIAELGGPGTLPAGGFTPWRLVMFAKTPGELLEHNYIQLDLNGKQALTDAAWIKPGKAIREVTLSTEGAHKLIDFAAAHHIEYIGFDAGWYGSEDYALGDATHERTTDKGGQPAPLLDIQETVRYGKAQGVGVWVYIDHKQAEKQRDILFPLYEKWGLAGVKIGFVSVGTEKNTSWIMETIRKASEHHLMVDIHDSYRTTGYTRQYPNLLTVEGVRGNEHFPTPEHNATLPFTRYLAGSADYTICYFSPRLINTHAHQLAMSVISYSPEQWVFWYDKPADFRGEPEISWFERLPTVWNETRVPMGEIGKYAVLARRKGTEWFVGAIGDSDGMTLHLPMKFLQPGVTYDATIFTDDPTVTTATHVAISHRRVGRNDILDLSLLPLGGEAIHLQPVTENAGN